MMGKTHILAGAVAGYLVFPHWSGVLVGVVGGMVPDIDEPNSKISRIGLLRLISYPISFLFRHRTITHSLPFLVASFVISLLFFLSCMIILSFWTKLTVLTIVLTTICLSLAFASGMASHLAGDMLTGKIKLLYPSQKSYGLSIPRWSYRIVDMIIRIALIGVIVVGILYGNVLQNLLGLNLNHLFHSLTF
jgi:inner membrane protein